MTVLKNINFKVSNSWVDAGSLTYPIGSVYTSVNSTSPAILFGGTWEAIKDRFLVGAGNSYTTKATGGEATHTLTVSEMAPHSHRMMMGWGANSGVWNTFAGEVGAGARWGTNAGACDGLRLFDGNDAVDGGGRTTTYRPTTQHISGSELPSKCGDVVCHHSSIFWTLFTQLVHTTSQKAQLRLRHSLEELGAKLQTDTLKEVHQQAQRAVRTPLRSACSIFQVLSGPQTGLVRIPSKYRLIMRALQDMEPMLRLRELRQRFQMNLPTGQSICGIAQSKVVVGGAC